MKLHIYCLLACLAVHSQSHTAQLADKKVNPKLNKHLFLAVETNNPTKIQQLFSEAEIPDINFREPKEGRTPLYLAVNKGSEPLIKMLLDFGANPNTLTFEEETEGDTSGLIGLAIERRNPVIAKLLIDAKANLNGQDDGGRTPLMFATITGQPEIVKQLLKAGADSTIHNEQDNNKTAQDYARSKPEVERVFAEFARIQSPAHRELLKSAAQKTSQEMLKAGMEQARQGQYTGQAGQLSGDVAKYLQ